MTDDDDPDAKHGKHRQVIPYEGKKWFEVKDGVYDFTRIPGDFLTTYDEDVVRHNINKVKRPDNIVVVAPSAQKEIEVVEPVNFVDKNKTGMREVADVNKKRIMMMQKQKELKRSTRSSASLLSRASSKTKASSYQESVIGKDNLLTPLRLKSYSSR